MGYGKLIHGTKNQVKYVKNNFGRKISRSPVRLYHDSIALYHYMKDSDVSWTRKSFVVGALVYLINPFDLIPDVLPGGFIDDMAVIAFIVKWLGDELNNYYDF
jgi:uncharacterized membrane protein YkvA (DUF1232 family)